jgi:hypothetical protein
MKKPDNAYRQRTKLHLIRNIRIIIMMSLCQITDKSFGDGRHSVEDNIC